MFIQRDKASNCKPENDSRRSGSSPDSKKEKESSDASDREERHGESRKRSLREESTPRARKMVKLQHTSSEASSEEMDTKDPPFSPKKLALFRDGIKILEAAKKRLQDMNLKLQERLNKAEEKLESFQTCKVCSGCRHAFSSEPLDPRKNVLPSPMSKGGMYGFY